MVNYDHLPAASRFFNGKLYQKMNEDLQLAGMSKRTVHGYLRAVRQLADYCQRRPDQITQLQLRRYFLYLKNEKQFAYGSIRVAFSGIKFFYTRTCKRSWGTLATMKLQQAKTLPEVLTIEQVHRIVDACRVERIALYFWTVYSMGLRLEEARNLQVGDRGSLKRGGDRERVRLEIAEPALLPMACDDLLGLEEALQKLEQQHPRKAELVKLRFFAGLTTTQAAKALEISTTTAENDWAYARSWLRLEMSGEDPD